MKTKHINNRRLFCLGILAGLIFCEGYSPELEAEGIATLDHKFVQRDYARYFLGDKYSSKYELIHFHKNLKDLSLENYIEEKLQGSAQEIIEEVTRAIRTESAAHKIDPLFVLSQIEVESQFKLNAVGTHGEIGLLQIKPSIAKSLLSEDEARVFQSADLFKPAVNIRLGLAYLFSLKKNYSHYAGSFVDAYNMGPSRYMKRVRAGTLVPSTYGNKIRNVMLKHYDRMASSVDSIEPSDLQESNARLAMSESIY